MTRIPPAAIIPLPRALFWLEAAFIAGTPLGAAATVGGCWVLYWFHL